jgi:Zn-dependent protease
LTDFTLQQIVLRLCAFVVIIAVHGFAVAGTAVALGDQGPRQDGRVSLSPLAHLDLLGLVSGVLFSVGWIKPIDVDAGKLRLGRFGLVVITLAAAVAVLAVALALHLVRPALLPLLSDTPSTLAFALIETVGQLGIWFVVVNLLPVPPFTGSLLLAALIHQARDLSLRVHLYAALLLMAVSATGIITGVLAPAHGALSRLVLGQ